MGYKKARLWLRVIGWRFPKPHYAILLLSERPAVVPHTELCPLMQRWSRFLGKYLSNWQPQRYSFLILYHVLTLTLQRGVWKGNSLLFKIQKCLIAIGFTCPLSWEMLSAPPVISSWELCTKLLFNHVFWVVSPVKCHIYPPVALNVLLWHTDDPELRFSKYSVLCFYIM